MLLAVSNLEATRRATQIRHIVEGFEFLRAADEIEIALRLPGRRGSHNT